MTAEQDGGSIAWILVITLGLVGWWQGWWKEDEWTGYVYPDATNLAVSFEVGKYKEFEECQQTAINGLRAIPGGAEGGDYECGLNCKPGDLEMNVCKVTRK